jgi:hypothetical protein
VITTLAAQAPTTGSEGISAPTATILSAAIAFVTACIVSIVTNFLTHKREKNEYRRELNLKRLNELYAPLKLLLAQDLVLIDQLREGKPPNWHILDHVRDVLGDEQDKAIASQILENNKKIARILEEKSGLCLVPIPDSFSSFLGHYSMLSRALGGREFVREGKFAYFPKAFEADVIRGYVRLAEELKKEVGE